MHSACIHAAFSSTACESTLFSSVACLFAFEVFEKPEELISRDKKDMGLSQCTQIVDVLGNIR
jgi:hypothetical protein